MLEYDPRWMKKAIEISLKGRYTAPPNPWVGAVVVHPSGNFSEGFHQAPGMPHAEIEAFHKAQEPLYNSTLYVTLEPCSHYGRTPPCAEAIIRSGIKRVIIGVKDPDPSVCGLGIKMLKEAGILVLEGVLRDEVIHNLEPYLYHRITGLPYCIVKAATSLDGKIACADYTSKWITSELSRKDVQHLRQTCQAIIIGSGTANLDHPHLTVRLSNSLSESPNPLRVIIDLNGSLTCQGPLFDTSQAKTCIFTSEKVAASGFYAPFEQKGVCIYTIPSSCTTQQQIALEILKKLGSQGILQVLVEGGSHIYDLFLNSEYVNKLVLYIAPFTIGCRGIPFAYQESISTIADCKRWKLRNVHSLENDIKVEYELTHNNWKACLLD